MASGQCDDMPGVWTIDTNSDATFDDGVFVVHEDDDVEDFVMRFIWSSDPPPIPGVGRILTGTANFGISPVVDFTFVLDTPPLPVEMEFDGSCDAAYINWVTTRGTYQYRIARVWYY